MLLPSNGAPTTFPVPKALRELVLRVEQPAVLDLHKWMKLQLMATMTGERHHANGKQHVNIPGWHSPLDL